MNPRLGWALALTALVVGGAGYGWRGLALAASAVFFWLLLQLNRSVRVMKTAAQSPVGTVPSAVMLQSRIRPGLPMLQVVAEAGSLGRQLAGDPETWAWTDPGGNTVRVAFEKGRCTGSQLVRPAEPDAPAGDSLSSGDPPPTNSAT